MGAHRLANFKNLVILSEIEAAGADAVEGPSHRFAYCTNLKCEDPSTRLRSLRMTGLLEDCGCGAPFLLPLCILLVGEDFQDCLDYVFYDLELLGGQILQLLCQIPDVVSFMLFK